MKFYFYLKLLSIHKSAFINALASKANVEVTVFSEYDIIPDRSEMGWVIPNLVNVEVIIKPSPNKIQESISNSDNSSIHIFFGVQEPSYLVRALQIALTRKKRIAIWAEPYRWIGITGYLRYLRGIYQRFKYGLGINFLLPTGNKGIETYQKAGFPNNKIFEWGYFTEKIPDLVVPTPDSYFNICFVGALIKRKGIDILLNAFARINDPNIRLHIVGEGNLKNTLIKYVKDKSLKNVYFHTYMPNKDVCRFIGTQDLLVLPSRLDGWGAVVNEALMQGTPVICSDNCGSSVLLNHNNVSNIFKSGNVNALATLIQQKINLGKISPEERTRIRKWAQCISGEEAANYFLHIVNHVFYDAKRPIPPWKENHRDNSFTHPVKSTQLLITETKNSIS